MNDMNEWITEEMNVWFNGRLAEYNGRVDAWMDSWMDGWMNKCKMYRNVINEWTDKQIDE